MSLQMVGFHLYVESKEQKEQTNQKQTHKYGGQSGDRQREGGLRG